MPAKCGFLYSFLVETLVNVHTISRIGGVLELLLSNALLFLGLALVLNDLNLF